MRNLKRKRRVAILSSPANGITKELNLVELNGKLYYHAGAWMNGKNIEGIFLNRNETAELLKTLAAEEMNFRANDTEIEKFQKDYAQQSHNGNAVKEDITW